MIHTFDGNRYYYRKINNSINLRAVLRKMKTLFKHQNHKSNVWKFKIRVAMEFFFNDRSSPLSAFLLFSMKRKLVFIQLKFRRLRILLVPECATTGGYLQGCFITDFKNRYFYVFNRINIMSMTRPYKTIFQYDFPAEVFLSHSSHFLIWKILLRLLQLRKCHRTTAWGSKGKLIIPALTSCVIKSPSSSLYSEAPVQFGY